MTVAKDWEDLDGCPGGSIQGKQRGEHGGEGDGDVWVDKVFHKCGNWSLDLPSSTELLSGHGDPCNSRDRTNAVSWPGRLAASAKSRFSGEIMFRWIMWRIIEEDSILTHMCVSICTHMCTHTQVNDDGRCTFSEARHAETNRQSLPEARSCWKLLLEPIQKH